MIGFIGIILIVWGVYSLLYIRKMKRSLSKSKRWAETIIKNLEYDKQMSDKL